MGKLSFLLAEDYIKPKIYFKSKQSPTVNVNALYSSKDHENFSGLENLTQLLCSPKGFIVNAFQIDFYQTLPRLIAQAIKRSHSFKKLYILGPELSLSILKRSTTTIYESHFKDYEYINVEQDSEFVTDQCVNLLKEGHILYILPETSVCWRPQSNVQTEKVTHALCSTFLSQQVNVPILATASVNDTNHVKIFPVDCPKSYTGDLEIRVNEQSETIYKLLESSKLEH